MASRISVIVSLTILAAALAAPFMAQAEAPAAAGDAKRGHTLAYTCNGCHAIPNYKNVYPTYSVPKLRGQRADYLVAALKEYKSGERSHGTMHSQAASMSEQDMADIAAYLAGPTVLTKHQTQVTAANPPKALVICVACHSANGVADATGPVYPSLAGQHADYIERALHDYRRGGRKNAIMAGMAQSLTEDDIEELAEYYAHQAPALETVHKKQFAFSAD